MKKTKINPIKGALSSLLIAHFYTGTVSFFLNNRMSETIRRFKTYTGNISDNEKSKAAAGEIKAADIFISQDAAMDKYNTEKIFKKIYTRFGVTGREYESSGTYADAMDILNTVFKSSKKFIAAFLIGSFLCGCTISALLNKMDVVSDYTKTSISVKNTDGINYVETVYLKDNESELRSYLSKVSQKAMLEKDKENKFKVASIFKIANPTLSESVCSEYASYVIEASNKYKVPPLKLAGLIIKESTVKKNSVSGAGALGLTQVMPLHVKTLRHEMPHLVQSSDDLLTPRASIHAGAFILSCYKDTYKRWDYAFKRYLGIKRHQWDQGGGNSYAGNILKWERIGSNITGNEQRNLDREYTKANNAMTPDEARIILTASLLGSLNMKELTSLTALISGKEDLREKTKHMVINGRTAIPAEMIQMAKVRLKKDKLFSSGDISPLLVLMIKIVNNIESENPSEMSGLLAKVKNTSDNRFKKMINNKAAVKDEYYNLELSSLRVLSQTAEEIAKKINFAKDSNMTLFFAEK